MFTGIIEKTGTVKKLTTTKNLAILDTLAWSGPAGIKKGDSIAINGVCLTVTQIKKNILSFDIMKETLTKTTLGALKLGNKVNLERALKANGRIDGHFVTGHVDHMATLKKKITLENYTELRFSLNKKTAPYFVPKGSVCVDGISLTVGEVKKSYFSVYLIPFTLKVTTLGTIKEGDQVNIETDILGKYILNSVTDKKG